MFTFGNDDFGLNQLVWAGFLNWTKVNGTQEENHVYKQQIFEQRIKEMVNIKSSMSHQ